MAEAEALEARAAVEPGAEEGAKRRGRKSRAPPPMTASEAAPVSSRRLDIRFRQKLSVTLLALPSFLRHFHGV
jgi:hypothetical protein